MASDTIAAIATARGAGGIAIVRISGERAGTILRAMFVPAAKGRGMADRRLTYGHVVDASGSAIDEVMAVLMRGPGTYTREDVAEIHCHGGAACASAVLERALALGARPAEPGEFTKRAFLNGRIDLARVEAVMQLIG
ncbi:MAG: tRNA uridine-5-carboxymethylaminomethyl(34) synthesis GTPase MnmE, partial [Clostridia bacterium]|nr:tRNA uridine-5-carboxymethylaminomethyl(34) synthesis GTPase MnmE [Clostridia bacterium]